MEQWMHRMRWLSVVAILLFGSGCSMLTGYCTQGILCSIDATRGEMTADPDGGANTETIRVVRVEDRMQVSVEGSQLRVSVFREKSCDRQTVSPRQVEVTTTTRLNWAAYLIAGLSGTALWYGTDVMNDAEKLNCTSRTALICLEQKVEMRKATLIQAVGLAGLVTVAFQLFEWDTVHEWKPAEPLLAVEGPYACGIEPNHGHLVTLRLPDGTVDHRRADAAGDVVFDLVSYPVPSEKVGTQGEVSYGFHEQSMTVDFAAVGWR